MGDKLSHFFFAYYPMMLNISVMGHGISLLLSLYLDINIYFYNPHFFFFHYEYMTNTVSPYITKKKYLLRYFQTKAHLDVLADALLRWARGR